MLPFANYQLHAHKVNRLLGSSRTHFIDYYTFEKTLNIVVMITEK